MTLQCDTNLTVYVLASIMRSVFKMFKDTMASAEATSRKMATRSSVYLWEFLLEVLEDEELQLFCCWIDKRCREFCIKDPDEISKLWGIMKHRPFMDKKKLLRAIRYYYTSGLITKVAA